MVSPYEYGTHPLTNLPYFCFGILMWRLMPAFAARGRRTSSRVLLPLALITGAGMAIFGPVVDAAQMLTLPVPLALVFGWGVVFGALVLSQALGPNPVLVNRATRFLGTISYSLYLSHPLLIYASGLPLLIAERTGSTGLTVPLVILAVALLAIPLAWVLYRIVEVPFIALGRRLTAGAPVLEAKPLG